MREVISTILSLDAYMEIKIRISGYEKSKRGKKEGLPYNLEDQVLYMAATNFKGCAQMMSNLCNPIFPSKI